MSISIVLYGDLKQKMQNYADNNSNPLIVNLPYEKINNIYDILEKLNIKEDEISHIFVNHNYCGPGIEVKNGDRVALFPRRMSIMFEEIPHSNSIRVIVKLSAELRDYKTEISVVDIPKGSNIAMLIKKINIPFSRDKLNILVNEVPCNDSKYTLKEQDVIKFFF
ncbi:MAG: MoaD/ThiS family protein [Candidatus Hodarchaeota archaeon]